MCSFGVPVGVVKVKKPCEWKQLTEDDNILGELFDYVSHLRTYAGRNHAFGILSSYNQWCIAWLPDVDTDNIAASTTLDDFDQQELFYQRFLLTGIINLDSKIPNLKKMHFHFKESYMLVTSTTMVTLVYLVFCSLYCVK